MKCVICRLLVQVIFLSFVRTVLNSCEIDFNHEKEGEPYPFDTYVYNGTISDCECDDLTNICVRKCCDLNYMYSEKNCILNSTYDFKVNVYDGETPVAEFLNFRYVAGKLNCGDGVTYYQLNPLLYSEDAFYLQRNGSLWQPDDKKYIIRERYCLENFEDIGLSAFVCVEAASEEKDIIYTVGMMISMPFLFTTFLVYGLLPERNLHGKSLMSYVISLFGAYLCLVIIQKRPDIVGSGCVALGTFCLFFFMVSFLWMNVMSIDIWWTFRGIRGLSGNKKEVEQKRFLLYTAYSWGVPLIFVVIVTIINASAPLNAWYKPGIGDGQCWFNGGFTTFIYFYAPLCIIILFNVVLFARTAWRIREMHQDTAILRQSENRISAQEYDKQRFNLYLKLLMAMGVNWSMEIISWAVDWQVDEVHPAIWILTDLCNALYGVFIFFIFVFKRAMWNLLKKRYYMARGQVQLAKTIRASDAPSTSTTVISLCKRVTAN